MDWLRSPAAGPGAAATRGSTRAAHTRPRPSGSGSRRSWCARGECRAGGRARLPARRPAGPCARARASRPAEPPEPSRSRRSRGAPSHDCDAADPPSGRFAAWRAHRPPGVPHYAGLGTGALILGGVPVDPALSKAARRRKVPLARGGTFPQGVASGMPSQNAITLWTRLEGFRRDRRVHLEVPATRASARWWRDGSAGPGRPRPHSGDPSAARRR